MQQPHLHERILNTALDLAEASTWERLHLHTVAEALHITLDEIRQEFPQKDDLVEAWFDHADRTMLAAERGAGFAYRPLHERLCQVITSWLDALSPHRRLTREMLRYKLEPGHVHLQVAGIMRISRTVQWFRECACQDSTEFQRILDETVLTTIYLTTFTRWLFDDSGDSIRSKTFLGTALRRWLGNGSMACRHSPEAEKTTEEQKPGN